MVKLLQMKMMLLLCALIAGSGSVWAESKTIKYTVLGQSQLEIKGTAPTGSSATISQTYTNSPFQMTSGNSHTLTLSGYAGYKVTNITLSMRSNASSGAGKLSYSIDGGSTFTYLVGSNSAGVKFSDANWNNAWSSTYVDVSKNVDIEPTTSNFIIKIEATANSLFCQSYSLTYEPIATSDAATSVTIDATGITNTDVYTNTAAGSLSATVKDKNGDAISGATVTWTSADTNVATIASDGTVTLVGAGTTVITASYAGMSGTYDPSSATYDLTVTDSTPFAGGDVTFTAGTDLGTTSANNSPDEVTKSVVTISSTDAAFATAQYRLYSGSTTTISTTEGKITKIVFTKDGSYSLSSLSATEGTYDNGTWTGNAKSVAFTASAQVRLSTIVVTVSMTAKDPVATINGIDPTSIAVGADGDFTFDITYADGLTSSDATITWESDDEDVLANISGSYFADDDEGTANVTVTVTPNSDTYEPVSRTFAITVFVPMAFSEFYESFDDCNGDGGNDGSWGSISTTGNITTENDWTFTNGNKANQCARFGTSKNAGSAQTPALNLDPLVDYVLLFKAGAWSSASTTLTLNATDNVFNGQASTTVSMVNENWKGFHVELTNGSATTKITFASTGRFFLDEVRVMEKSEFEALSLNETVSSNGWKSYIPAYNVSFAEGVAYAVTAVDETDGTVTIQNITSAPAKTPLLLKGTGEKSITAITTDVTAPETNMLSIGDGTEMSDPEKYPYVLAKDGDGAGFKQWTGEGSTLKDRVVLMLDFAQTGEARMLRFVENEINGIENVEQATSLQEAAYDLQGRRVMQPTKGLYIVNGKKFMVK